MNIQPVHFLKQGSVIEARFINDEDEPQWYRGVVQRVNHVGENLVDCVVLYEDGELVNNAVFHDDDFDNDESIDAWRFEGNMSLLIEFLTKNSEEIKGLKEAIKDRDDAIRQVISDAMFVNKCFREEDSTDDEDYDYDDEDDNEDDDESDEENDEFETYDYPSPTTTSRIWSFMKKTLFVASAFSIGYGIGSIIGPVIKQHINKDEI